MYYLKQNLLCKKFQIVMDSFDVYNPVSLTIVRIF
jgi:hypothetical protein